jgi:hypothetical protein
MPPRRSDYELQDLAEQLAPRVRWSAFRRLFEVGPDGFKQGDHVTIIAPTGGGKTTLAVDVVEIRTYCLGRRAHRARLATHQHARYPGGEW